MKITFQDNGGDFRNRSDLFRYLYVLVSFIYLLLWLK